ncbi:GNAT family N-acetyltransferase [Curtobacterium sp. RRHDQ10]|uniref:GNAT family N-acetyltransferase n=1 Tax=Curtobacterium phyllosphaerae TaxID=3413379 RepID=UPI003BF04FCB
MRTTSNDAPDDRYELRWSQPALTADGTAVDAQTTAFTAAIGMGFHEPRDKPADLLRQVRHQIAMGQDLLAVHRRDPVPGSVDETQPVGTFVSFRKELSWGQDGAVIDTFAIAGVTVRPTERRRGVLRRMMTASLDRAVDQGYAIAALTASEGSIYRRFGFGCAIRERVIEVRRRGATPFLVPTSGEVVVVEPSTLQDGLAADVYARFHTRTPGSMARNPGAWDSLLGRTSDDEQDPAVRAAVHHPADGGTVDGYVAYRVVEGETDRARLDVIDLVYATDEAYLGLWDYLLAVDLNERVRYTRARLDDPIVHAVPENRAVSIVHEEDHVWLRVLDPVRVLESRPYATDGVLTIGIADALEHASGTYRLTVREGRGRVERIGGGPASGPAGAGPASAAGAELGGAGAPEAGTPDLLLDVADLGAVLIGAIDPVGLAAAGLVDGSPAAVRLLRAMLAPERAPHGISYF